MRNTDCAIIAPVSIYFGGGTPSLLTPEEIATILSWLPCSPTTEVTLEANPESVTIEKMRSFKEAGINRVSIGIQAFDDALLTALSRGHTCEQAKNAVSATYEAGITNISIDLMYDLPYQSRAQWQASLHTAASLPITHLSLYNLTIEPQTVFYKYRERLNTLRPTPETSREMYCDAMDLLEEAGLKQYEISAFARDGRISCHNTGYWKGRPFIGLGPSAFSYWKGSRFRNHCHFNRWAEACSAGLSPTDYSETLDSNASRRELLTIGLRLRDGVDLSTFAPLENETIDILDRHIAQGLLQRDGAKVALTKEGRLFYDSIAVDLI